MTRKNTKQTADPAPDFHDCMRMAETASTRFELDAALAALEGYVGSRWSEVRREGRERSTACGLAARARGIDPLGAVMASQRGRDPFAGIFASPAAGK